MFFRLKFFRKDIKMSKNNTYRKINTIGHFIIKLSFAIAILTMAAGMAIRFFAPASYGVEAVSTDWTDENGAPFSLAEFNGYNEQEHKILPQRVYRKLSVTDADTAVIFRCRNCYCNVYQNGRLIDEDMMPDFVIYGKSPGSRWHIVSIAPSDEPVEICLEVTTCFRNSNGLIDNFYLGTPRNVFRKVVLSRIAGFTVSTFLMLIGAVILVLYAYLRKHHNVERDLLYLGIATFASSLWSSTESFLWQLFLGYSEVIHLLEYVALAGIPLGFGLLASYRIKGKFGRFALYYSIASAVNLIVITLLHVTGILEFHYTLAFTHALLVILIPVLIKLVLSYTSDDDPGSKRLTIFMLLAILVICLATALFQYITGRYSSYSFYARISILCFLLCLIVYQLNQMATTFSKGLKADMLHDLALTDHMTGLFNRAAFSEHMDDYNHFIASFSPLGVIQFDVNNLKKVNDTLGHEKGDQMIIAVADGLKSAFGDGCHTYRTGGDEFLTIIQAADPDDTYRSGIGALQNYCDKQNARTDLGFKLHIAHGYILVKGNMELSEAIEAADVLMYENKRELKRIEAEKGT